VCLKTKLYISQTQPFLLCCYIHMGDMFRLILSHLQTILIRCGSLFFSSSSISTTTLSLGFGLLNCRWAFPVGRFYRVPLPAERQTPNMEENQGFRAFQLSPQETPSFWSDAGELSSERWNYGREMAEKFCRKWWLPRHFWVLLHAVKHDMGQTVLLPLRRKACWGFFRPKNPTASAGFEPANSGTKASTLPLDHRSRYRSLLPTLKMHYGISMIEKL
jgi:hypothetical protein